MGGGRIREVLWDEHVVEHLARHDVAPGEVEQVIFHPATQWEMQETHRRRRLVAVGWAAHRLLFVVCEMPSRTGTTVCVTARRATEREERIYNERRNHDNQG